MITAPELRSLLALGRFDLAVEARTQNDIATFLAGRLPLGCLLEREKVLSPGERPDFLVDGRIVIEVKVGRIARAPIWRQLERYARRPEVEAIILATGRSVGASGTILGKPVLTLSLGAAWL